MRVGVVLVPQRAEDQAADQELVLDPHKINSVC